jgi:hypothetical protein
LNPKRSKAFLAGIIADYTVPILELRLQSDNKANVAIIS